MLKFHSIAQSNLLNIFLKDRLFVFCLRCSFAVFQSCEFSQQDGELFYGGGAGWLFCYDLLISASAFWRPCFWEEIGQSSGCGPGAVCPSITGWVSLPVEASLCRCSQCLASLIWSKHCAYTFYTKQVVMYLFSAYCVTELHTGNIYNASGLSQERGYRPVSSLISSQTTKHSNTLLPLGFHGS